MRWGELLARSRSEFCLLISDFDPGVDAQNDYGCDERLSSVTSVDSFSPFRGQDSPSRRCAFIREYNQTEDSDRASRSIISIPFFSEPVAFGSVHRSCW
jgi:hypothetical protein